jgi:butyrate kinase
MKEVEERVNEGDAEWKLVRDAMILQISKDIGSMACVLNGKVDQILITGGIAYNSSVTHSITERTGWIAPVSVYPGEDELLALVQGALRVMNGEEQAMVY